MDKVQIMQKVKEQVSKKFNIPIDQINGQTTFDSVGGDSLDVTEMVMDIEEEFKINLNDQKSLPNVESFVDHIHELLESKK